MALKLFKKKADGRLEINPLKHATFPYYLCTDAPNTVVVVPAGGNTSAPTPMTVTQEGPFEGFYLTGQYNNAVMIRIQDQAAKRMLMNREIHWDTIVGGTGGAAGDGDLGIRPFILPQTMFLHQRRSLIVDFRDLAAAGANVRFAIGGRRFYPTAAASNDLQKFIKQKVDRYGVATPYFLTTDAQVNIAGPGTTTWRMSVGAEAHFVGYKLSYVTTLAADPTFYLTDAETGRVIMNGNTVAGIMQAADGIGTAQFPYIFPEPWFIERNGAINLTLTAAGAGIFYFTIAGIRIYSR